MRKVTLSKEQIEDLIFESRYKIDEKEILLPLDDFEIVVKAANEYGFELKKDRVKKIIKDLYKQAGESFHLNNHFNGAILHIRGNYSLEQAFSFPNKEGIKIGELFIFHESFVNIKHRELAKKLIQDKVVSLFPGCDEEYLYEALSDATENYLFDLLKKQAEGLPLYLVEFEEDGSFLVREMGRIS